MGPKVSIVTPSFNSADFLEETIQSVLSQQYKNIEYIVIDGGSTDSTPEILQRYRDRLSFVVSESDNGHTHALAKGFSHASGDILTTLNADDLYEPGAIGEVVQFFTQHQDVRFIYGDTLEVDRYNRIIRTKREISFYRFLWLHTYNYIPQPSAFWRRDLYEEVGGVDLSFKYAMDGDLWARFAEVTKPRHVSRFWTRYRIYPEQTHQRLSRQCIAEEDRIRRRMGIEPSGPKWRIKRAVAKAIRVSMKVEANLNG